MIQNITAQLGEGNIRSKSRGLTDYALMWAFDNMRYVARRASTPMPSETREFSYPYFDLETVLAQQAELLSPGGKAARAESKIERKSGYTETYGFAEEVNDHQRAEANGTAVDWDRQCTINVTRGCEKAREAEWKRVALNAASWTGKLTGQDAAVTVTGGTNPWGDAPKPSVPEVERQQRGHHPADARPPHPVHRTGGHRAEHLRVGCQGRACRHQR